MSYQYEITLSNGKTYDVTVSKHHEQHPQDVFLGHVVDMLKSIVSGVAIHHITKFRFKGRA